MDRTTKLMIIFGALILIVPSVFLLTTANSAFRNECKAKCVPSGQTYRIITTGYTSTDPLQYPAYCICIAPADRTVWERLRDSLW